MSVLDKVQILITKAKRPIEVDLTAEKEDGTPVFTDEVIKHLIQLGLGVALNARMAKVGAVTKLVGKELEKAQADAMVIANENLDDLKSGNLKHSRSKAKSTIPAGERAEAMLLAKRDIKDAVRAAGFKPSHYNDKAYTAKAKEYVEHDPYYLAQAKINIEARKTPAHPIQLDISTLGPATKRTAKPKSTDLPAGIVKPAGVQATHKPQPTRQ